jgi:hypothetical protein
LFTIAREVKMAVFEVDYIVLREVRDGRVLVEADSRREAINSAYALITQALPEPKEEFEIKIGVAKHQET